MRFFLFYFLCFIQASVLPLFTEAQPGMTGLRAHIEERKINDVQYAESIAELYKLLNYRSVWLENPEKLQIREYRLMLASCPDAGLKESDYLFADMLNFLAGSLYLKNTNDSVLFEERMSASLIHFVNDLFYGNRRPDFGYYGISYKPDCFNIPFETAEAIKAGKLEQLITRPMMLSPEIGPICSKLAWINSLLSSADFREAKIISPEVSNRNTLLIQRLYQLGFLDKPDKHITDTALRAKLKEAQAQFGLLDDGVLRTTAVKELNVSLFQRKNQLITAVNCYRWLGCFKNQSVTVVNIPEAYLRVWQKSNLKLEMRMIVGKRSAPTPTLASTISEVILYPYWHVPYSIATKELLPAIKRDPAVLDKGNYQVLDKAGRIVAPSAVNWSALGPGNFPYTIRQSTGCDNALGLLKLNFYNPFSVYLHDTPNPSFFMLKKRFLSHGCMRMEKPFEMGHLILQHNSIAIDTLEQAGCLRNQEPVTVKPSVNMPVIVWYNPAGIDSKGKLVFFEDIYEKFKPPFYTFKNNYEKDWLLCNTADAFNKLFNN